VENCEKIKNAEDSKRQQKHLLKLYQNLAVCYNYINEPQQACKMCQEALKIDPGSSKALFQWVEKSN
jgi:tetratricopeptide (TPR) repeat protein